jgi:hypothetical protein
MVGWLAVLAIGVVVVILGFRRLLSHAGRDGWFAGGLLLVALGGVLAVSGLGKVIGKWAGAGSSRLQPPREAPFPRTVDKDWISTPVIDEAAQVMPSGSRVGT